MTMKLFKLGFLFLLFSQALIAQEVTRYTFTQTNAAKKENGKIHYAVDYDVFVKGDTYSVLSEYEDISYTRMKGESYMYISSPLDGEMKKIPLTSDKAKWSATGEKRNIAGIACEEYELKFGDVKGTVFCSASAHPFPYFAFDIPDYYFMNSSSHWIPEGLPGSILAYDLLIPFIGYVKGELQAVENVNSMPAQLNMLEVETLTAREFENQYAAFHDGEYSKDIVLGEAAPTFSVLDINNQEVDLSKLKGKLVFLNFWATWCGGCVAEIPELNKLVEKYKGKNIEFIAVSEEASARIAQFLEKRAFNFQQLPFAAHIKNKYGARPMPRSVLIDGNGNIAAIFDHPLAPQFGGQERMEEEVKLVKATIDGLLNGL